MLQTLVRTVHGIQDRFGLPVNYTAKEFQHFKDQLDWSAIDADRVRLLAQMFGLCHETIGNFVAEAEAIEAEEMLEDDSGRWQGVGSPMGRTDRLTLYAAIRASRPQLVAETGTAAGASAVYILKAMEANQQGRLISVDATPDRANVGRLIPSELRARVELVAGNSLRVLPRCDLRELDFFLHDSCHTYRHMTAEYEFALSHFAGRGVLCSHDVLKTNAWKHVIQRHKVTQTAVVKNFGVLLADPQNA